MKISKAVITAAATDQRRLPLQVLVDQNGKDRTTLQLTIEEVTESGIEDICFVIRPGDREAFELAAGEYADRIHLVEQETAKGYADAILQAKSFVDGQPFLHLVGDHLYLSDLTKRCAAQILEQAQRESCAISAVQPTRENKLASFGAVGARRIPQQPDLFEVTQVIEKPTPTQAEQELVVAGLRAGSYLCIAGMHVLPSSFMEILETESATGVTHISTALDKLADRERYLAFQIQGNRYDIGAKYGLLTAQLQIALSGRERDEVLTQLVEVLATQTHGKASSANQDPTNSDSQASS